MLPKMRMPDIISEIYRKRYKINKGNAFAKKTYMQRPVHYPVGPYDGHGYKRPAFERFQEMLSNHYVIAFLILGFVIKAMLAIHYYNLLTNAEQNMKAAYSDMNAFVQRRNDIAANLSKAVLDYSKYEEAVFTSIVGLRTIENNAKNIDSTALDKMTQTMQEKAAAQIPAAGSEAASAVLPAGKEIFASLSKLMAVAEQYPDLKLSANFSTLMAALIEVEKDLANQRVKFNAEANVYTTYLLTFPINFFAWVFDFNDFPYFEASEEAKSFKVIQY